MNSIQQEASKRSRRAFLTLGAGAVGVIGGWSWLNRGKGLTGLAPAFRSVLDANEKVASSVLFSDSHLAPQFAPGDIQEMRVNGSEGLQEELDLAEWRLKLLPRGAKEPSREFTVEEIKALPRVEHITSLKCIEGWSVVQKWAGVRLSDFTRKYAAGSEAASYVGIATPDDEYNVGIDTPSAMHPQTLLCYEMNGQPLTSDHGAPLRLVIPVKYGVKNIKRIGTIQFADQRPPDFWANLGYDYYCGL